MKKVSITSSNPVVVGKNTSHLHHHSSIPEQGPIIKLVNRDSQSNVGAASSAGAGSRPAGIRRHVSRPIAKSTEIKDIVPHENPGVAGDVITTSDLTLTEEVHCIEQTFRNVINPYDTIGSDLQIVSIVCGHEHAGAITRFALITDTDTVAICFRLTCIFSTANRV